MRVFQGVTFQLAGQPMMGDLPEMQLGGFAQRSLGDLASLNFAVGTLLALGFAALLLWRRQRA